MYLWCVLVCLPWQLRCCGIGWVGNMLDCQRHDRVFNGNSNFIFTGKDKGTPWALPPDEAFQFLRAKCHSRASAAGPAGSWQRKRKRLVKINFICVKRCSSPSSVCNTFLNESDVPPIVPISNLAPKVLEKSGERCGHKIAYLDRTHPLIHWVFVQYILKGVRLYCVLPGEFEGAGAEVPGHVLPTCPEFLRHRWAPSSACQRVHCHHYWQDIFIRDFKILHLIFCKCLTLFILEHLIFACYRISFSILEWNWIFLRSRQTIFGAKVLSWLSVKMLQTFWRRLD